MEFVALAKKSWVRVQADMGLGAYVAYVPKVDLPDPILGDLPGFGAAAKYIFDVLFGRLPHQGRAQKQLGRLLRGKMV